MKLIRLEWKKLMSKQLCVMLAILFLLHMICYYVCMMPFMPTDKEREIRKEWEQTIETKAYSIEETLDFLEQTNENLIEVGTTEEIQVLSDMTKEYTTVLEYQSFIAGLKERADAMEEIAIFRQEGGFAKRNIEKTVVDFSDLKTNDVQPMNSEAMESLHQFYLTDILLLLIICLLCFAGHGNDYKTGMADLVQASPRGQRWLRIPKLCAINGMVLLTSILFYGSNILLTEWQIGFGELTRYVQGLTMFRNMPFLCEVREYLLYYLLWKSVVLFVVSLLFQCIVIWCRGRQFGWMLIGVVMVTSFGLWFFLPDSSVGKIFRYLNPIGLLDVRQIIGNYQNLNLFRYPITLSDAAITVIVAMSILLLVTLLLVQGKERFRGLLRFGQRNTSRMHKTVFAYEFRKIIINQRAWILLLLFVLFSGWTIYTESTYVSVDDYYYETLQEEYQGEYTEAKTKAIVELWESGQFAGTDKEKAFQRIYEQANYLSELTEEDKGFVNLHAFDTYFYSKKTEIRNTLYVVIVAALALASLYEQETKKQLKQLLCTTPRCRSVYWAKVQLAAGIGGLSSLMIWGMQYGNYVMENKLEGLSFAVQSIVGFEELPFRCSIGAYMLGALLIRTITGMYLGVIIGFLTQIFSIPAQNIMASLCLLILPLCMAYIGQMEYQNRLILFIREHLGNLLYPMLYLASFPTTWFTAGSGIGMAALSILIFVLWIGKILWRGHRG